MANQLPAFDSVSLAELQLSIDSVPWRLSEYDLLSADLIREALQGSESVVLLGPTPVTTSLLAVLTNVLHSIGVEVGNKRGKFQQTLTPGDLVMFRGRRGVYRGIESLGGSAGDDPKLKVDFSDMSFMMSADDIWQLSKCDPNAWILDSYARGRKTDVTPRKPLADLLNVDSKYIPPTLDTGAIVLSDKSPIIEAYQAIKAAEKPLPEIVPAAYHSGITRYQLLQNTALPPMISFARSADIAESILARQRTCIAFFINGMNRIRGKLTHLEHFQQSGIPIVILDYLHAVEFQELERLEKMGFTVVTWDPDDIKPLVALGGLKQRLPDTENGGIISVEHCRLHNVARWSKSQVVIDEPEGERIAKLRKLLLPIARSLETDDVQRLVNRIYFVINVLTNVPLSGEQLSRFSFDLRELSHSLYEQLAEVYRNLSQDARHDITEAIAMLNEQIDAHWERHPKSKEVERRVSQLGKSDVVLVRSGSHREPVERWLRSAGISASVLHLRQALNRQAKSGEADKIVSFGWYGEDHARLAYSGFSRKEIGLLYPFELEICRIHSSKLRKKLLRGPSSTLYHRSGSGDIVADSPEVLDDFIRRVVVGRWDSDLMPMSARSDGEDLVDTTFVTFEEGTIAFLTEHHQCRCINDAGNDIVTKNVRELVIGDQMVFVRDSAQDIFDKLVEGIKESDRRAGQIAELAGVWRVAFLKFLEGNSLTAEDFRLKLKAVGVQRSTAAIRSWMRPDLIGPNEDAIRGIARVTRDPLLTDSLEDVIRACSQTRGLHVAIGRALAQSIVTASIDTEPLTVEPTLRDVVGDLAKHAEYVTVAKIALESVSVPRNMVNRLVDPVEP